MRSIYNQSSYRQGLVELEYDAILNDLHRKFLEKRANHLGYPYNLDFDVTTLSQFSNFLINNLGDPYAGSHYGTEVCSSEREVIDWIMRIWECDDPVNYWGAVGASGTEGNLWALYLAREALGDPLLVHSAEAHYSIPKAAKILQIEASACHALESGAICIESLTTVLKANPGRKIILALTCGTTMKGAHDDIAGCIAILDEAGLETAQRYIHVDGALNAMVLPFIDDVPLGIRPTFRHAIDSISTSGHKMIGTPMPCGVLVTRREHIDRVASAISYLRSNDTTLMGSRNGHAVLAIWNRLMRLDVAGFRADAQKCLAHARAFANTLLEAGVPAILNPFSLTVVFPKPSEPLVHEYQLACHDNLAHAIIMPNVQKDLINRFIAAYISEWASNYSKRAFS